MGMVTLGILSFVIGLLYIVFREKIIIKDSLRRKGVSIRLGDPDDGEIVKNIFYGVILLVIGTIILYLEYKL